MDNKQHMRSHANADANADADPNADPNPDPDANPNANPNPNHVRGMGRRQDIHRWPSGELSRCYLQGAVDSHRLRRHQLESEGHPNLVDGRRNLRYDADPDAYSDPDPNPNTNTNTNTNSDSDSDADANRHEETSVSWLYARKLCERLGLYPYG